MEKNYINLSFLNPLNGEVCCGIIGEHIELFAEDVFDPSERHQNAYCITFGFIFFKLSLYLHIHDNG